MTTTHKKASDYLNGTYWKKDDLVSGPQAVLVTDVEEAQNFDKTKPVLQLVLDDDKKLTLNATNTRRMIRDFGDDVSAWVGARITLYLDDAVNFKGKEVGGIRLRPTATASDADIPF